MLLCDGFFGCASVLTKSVAEVTFSVAYVLKVAFVALYHINEIRRRAGDVISYTSLFLVREKVEDVFPSVMKGHVLHLFL